MADMQSSCEWDGMGVFHSPPHSFGTHSWSPRDAEGSTDTTTGQPGFISSHIFTQKEGLLEQSSFHPGLVDSHITDVQEYHEGSQCKPQTRMTSYKGGGRVVALFWVVETKSGSMLISKDSAIGFTISWIGDW